MSTKCTHFVGQYSGAWSFSLPGFCQERTRSRRNCGVFYILKLLILKLIILKLKLKLLKLLILLIKIMLLFRFFIPLPAANIPSSGGKYSLFPRQIFPLSAANIPSFRGKYSLFPRETFPFPVVNILETY